MYQINSYIYRIKGTRLKVEILARTDEIAEQIKKYLSFLVKNPPEKLLKKKTIYIEREPYIVEQEVLNRYISQCKERGLI